MMLLPGACVVAFSLMIVYRKRKLFLETRFSYFCGMSILFLLGLVTVYIAEKAGNPIISELGITQELGSMEGKEMRFGVVQSALFTTVTTAFTTGSVNNMHDTLTPLGV